MVTISASEFFPEDHGGGTSRKAKDAELVAKYLKKKNLQTALAKANKSN